jgi:hypothetical protein
MSRWQLADRYALPRRGNGRAAWWQRVSGRRPRAAARLPEGLPPVEVGGYWIRCVVEVDVGVTIERVGRVTCISIWSTLVELARNARSARRD